MRLIGLHARLRAGKDTAYATIDRAANDDNLVALRRAFADPLKVSGMRSLGIKTTTETDDVVALANRIKETGKVLVTWDDVSPTTGNIIPNSMVVTGREFWQRYGTEAHRAEDLGHSFSPDFWVDNLLPQNDVQGPYTPPDPRGIPSWWHSFKESWAGFADIAVVTDVRFANEAERIRELGGEVWWIDAETRLGPNTDEHASEAKLPDELIDKTIDNNYGLAEFQNNVLVALNS